MATGNTFKLALAGSLAALLISSPALSARHRLNPRANRRANWWTGR